ncbi:hypothetical protein K503DRAFT_772484 [Rhizopogon vinicolor AM-OR11-026]|uniref:Uncharacterized protein n=1 Tax=Rhizopogon vinicolor AM-OR11-026 TaxID=1314800 RepID=A0A1B7MV12_9AGAM|nr:hypothetical protein K503DRAFT_772484 [Rhizopogon vinicolor AM-OR11-026]
MIKHPYGAPSSYLYANRDDSYSQSSYVSPPPEQLYSFMPRMSVDSMPWYGTTEYSGTSSNKDYDQQDSLPLRSTLRVCLHAETCSAENSISPRSVLGIYSKM